MDQRGKLFLLFLPDYTFLPPGAWQSHPGYYRLAAQPMPGWGQVKAAENPPQAGVRQPQPYGNVKRVSGPNQPGPYVSRSAYSVKPAADSKRTLEMPRPQANFLQPKPRSFELNVRVPVLNTDDKGPGKRFQDRGEGDHSQLHRPSPFHFENHYHSPPKVSSGSNKEPHDSPKPSFHLSLNVPVPPITLAPKPPSRGPNSEDAGTFETGSSPNRFYFPREAHEINKPVYHKHPESRPTFEKPTENKLETFFSGLLNLQRGPSDPNSQVDTQKEHSHMVVKPGSAQHPTRPLSSGFPTGHQTLANHWLGHTHLSSPTHAGSVIQGPVHHAAQSATHYSPQWYQIPTQANADPDRIRHNVMQSVQNINGQLMIPLDKCPGFHHYRQDHSQFPTSGQTSAKPQYAKVFVNMEGSGPNSNAPSSEAESQQFGTYHGYPYRWHHAGVAEPQSSGSHFTRTEPASSQFVNPFAHPSYVHKEPETQQSNVRPGHSNYMVHFGGNVGQEKRPNPGHVQYYAPQTPHHAHN